MSFFKVVLLILLLPLGATTIQAAPQQLLKVPLESPDGKYSANVEWDTAGFIGRLRMLIWTRGDKPTKKVELPQIKPSPANLDWINDDWVACESFIAERGAAFFYMDVPREKGYLIEIFAPDKNGDWLISYTTNDAVSSDTIHTLSEKHSSLFPILLRNLPENGQGYVSPDFTYLLSDAVDSYVEWRKRQHFSEMKFFSGMAENPKLGRLVVASFDQSAEIVYFPQGTTTTREMLALTQRQPFPEQIQKIINGIDPPVLKIEWTGDNGAFHVLAQREDDKTSITELIAGRFEGIADAPYTGPGVKELLTPTSDKKSSTKKDKGDSDKKKKKSSSKPKKKTSRAN